MGGARSTRARWDLFIGGFIGGCATHLSSPSQPHHRSSYSCGLKGERKHVTVRLTRIILLLTTILFTCNIPSYGQNPISDSPKLYAVIFGFVIDEKSELKSFRVSKVIDPRTRSTNAVDVKVPESYIAAAKARLMAKPQKPTIGEDGKLKEMFTYFFFDPMQPNRTDIE